MKSGANEPNAMETAAAAVLIESYKNGILQRANIRNAIHDRVSRIETAKWRY